ncbi:Csu type fimbrial protein [Aurantiacibacter zhengii]|uniref:SCPU domain-containing protein n=1 Tax=Aurantiacibacter zhengii TaxID=2307003 RepID=A0A418NMK9_9SPHN|nr:spore coat protein U domain-containing protein [Aurantiacibacter zhengii]RIV82218.1 SCPU domain-containing protein [Aurantiacibacter zhengii]
MTHSTKSCAVFGVTALALFCSSAAHAETATSTFDVMLDIDATCSVTAGTGSDIDLGTEDSDATDLSGSSTFSVNCSKTVPYNIGLAPSNGATNGAGVMSPAGSSADEVPYQLRQTSGASGTIWGDTATTTAVGNGVAGTGNGADQDLTVYVTVPSANYAPDSYSDTVTITVNY